MANAPQRKLEAEKAAPHSSATTRDYRRPLTDTPLTEQRSTAPERIGRYAIDRLLGTGGFGTVYLAHDPDLDRPVALKVARHGWSQSESERFLIEARTAAKLKHPHIVTIYEVGHCRELGVFIAMEYVEGETLEAKLRSGALPVEEAAKLLAHVADAMHYGHKMGVIHRDLKPANILIEHDDIAKVSDFGLALHEEGQINHKGEVSGTPAYMSPEQVRGEVDCLDGRTDIWSVGVILHECLTGKRPFTGSDRQAVYDQILHREAKPLRQIDDTIPWQMDELCRQCLARQSNRRPATALDVSRRLQQIAAQPQGRKWTAYGLAACLLLGLLAVAGLLLTSRNTPPATSGVPLQRQAPAAAGQWHSLLDHPPQTLVWDAGYPLNNHSYSQTEQKFSVRSNGWAIFSLGNNEGRNFDLRANQWLEEGNGSCGIFWGLHEDEHAFPDRKSKCRAVLVRKMPDGKILLRLMELTLEENDAGLLCVPHSTTLHSQRLSLDVTKSWFLRVSVDDGELVSAELQDQPITTEGWGKDDAAFSVGRVGIVCLNGYLVLTDTSIYFID